MGASYQSVIIDWLRGGGVEFEPGLSDDEVQAIEQQHGLRFPPDLRGLLQASLPVSVPFPNWRGPLKELQERLDEPVSGVCFDVEHSHHWRPEWGTRPANTKVALEIARREVLKAPRLIPVYSHRYLPSEPCQSGNPILSVVQTDIIIYGDDLAPYFQHEFGFPIMKPDFPRPRAIPFWGYYLGGVWDENETPEPSYWPEADPGRSNGYMGKAFLRDLEVNTQADILLYVRLTGTPSLWLWCQSTGFPPNNQVEGLDCYLWLDGHVWELGQPWGQQCAQPGHRSPYTELAGLVVAAEDGEVQLDCGARTFRVRFEGVVPAEGDWIATVGTLYGELEIPGKK